MKKVCRKCEIEKPLDEYYRDKRASDGKGSWCKECDRARRRQYHYDNHEKSTATSRAWKAKNKEQTLAKTQEWREKNKDAIKAWQKEYRAENRDKVNAGMRDWCRRNPVKKAHKDRKYYQARIQATPSWVTDADLALFYMEAAMLTEQTGVEYQVDHIVPLQHPMVCGLNVPANLQVITRSENASKSNTFEVG